METEGVTGTIEIEEVDLAEAPHPGAETIAGIETETVIVTGLATVVPAAVQHAMIGATTVEIQVIGPNTAKKSQVKKDQTLRKVDALNVERVATKREIALAREQKVVEGTKAAVALAQPVAARTRAKVGEVEVEAHHLVDQQIAGAEAEAALVDLTQSRHVETQGLILGVNSLDQ